MQICVRQIVGTAADTRRPAEWEQGRCIVSAPGDIRPERTRSERAEILLNEPFGMQQKAFASDGLLLCALADTLLHAGRWYIALKLK